MASSLPMAPLDQAFTLMSDQIKIGTQPGPAVKSDATPTMPPDEAREPSATTSMDDMEEEGPTATTGGVAAA